MFQRDQVEEQLKSKAKSALFEREFSEAVNKYLNEKKENTSKPYSEQVDWKKY